MGNIGLHFLVCFGVFLSNTDAHYMYGFENCHFTSEDGHDAVLTGFLYYNKQLMASYNSTEGKFIGYTEKTKEIADGLNKNPHILHDMHNGLYECINSVPALAQAFVEGAKKPQVKVFSTKTANSHQPGIIMCSAYNFYPKPITLTWLINREEVTSNVIFSEEMYNENWLYQKHSYLEYTATAIDTIECMVEHATLSSPELYKWEHFSESRKNKIIVGTAGILLGLAFVVAGVISYKRPSTGHVLVPKEQ